MCLSIVSIAFVYYFKNQLSKNFTTSPNLFTTSLNLFKSTINREVIHQVSANSKWHKVCEGLKQNNLLNIAGKNNILVENNVLENTKGHDAIAIVNSDNVHINNAVVDRLSGKNNLIHDTGKIPHKSAILLLTGCIALCILVRTVYDYSL